MYGTGSYGGLYGQYGQNPYNTYGGKRSNGFSVWIQHDLVLLAYGQTQYPYGTYGSYGTYGYNQYPYYGSSAYGTGQYGGMYPGTQYGNLGSQYGYYSSKDI